MAGRNRLQNSVVVITGASSGIGRATAVAFAREGASLVLAARREAALHEVAESVHTAGGKALVFPTDVRDPAQVQRLQVRAVEAFDGIDIWINNAGIASFGEFVHTPPEAFQAVMDTTFHGVVNGFRAVLPHMRDRRRGHILTTASVVGRIPTPYQAPYIAAKHAVLGFVETVRQELMLEGLDDIHVGSVLPGPVDTPFWQHAANYSGRDIKPLEPLSTPEQVADAFVGMVFRPRAEVGVGAPAWLLELGYALGRDRLERRMADMTRRNLFADRTRPRSPGSLGRPMAAGTDTSGGWIDQGYRKSGRPPGGVGLAGLLALAVPVGAAALYRYQRNGRVF